MPPLLRLSIAFLGTLFFLAAPPASTAAPASSNNIVVTEFLYYPPIPSTSELNAGFIDQNEFTSAMHSS